MSAAEGPVGLLDYRTDSDIAVVTVSGEVDVSTSSELRTGLLRVLTDEAYRGLVVNLANVNFIDSTGVGVLVGVWHRVRGTDDCLALAAPSRQARNILETTGLMKVLPVYDTEAEAVQACREPAAVILRSRARSAMVRSRARSARCMSPDAPPCPAAARMGSRSARPGWCPSVA